MSQIVFAVLLGVALISFSWTVVRLLRFMLQGRPFRGGFKEVSARIQDVLVYFLGQFSVAREAQSRHHLLIFWGFLIITIGTLELIIKGLWPDFSYDIFGDSINHGFKWVLDITNAVVLVVIVWSFFRRIVLRPSLILLSLDATLILGMIGLLCITHFLMHGLSFIATGEIHDYLPVS